MSSQRPLAQGHIRTQLEKQARIILDQMDQFVGLLDVEGHLLDANRIALEAAGTRLEEVVGRLFWETPWWSASSEVQERLKDAIRRAARGECVRFQVQHRIAADSRELMTVAFSLRPIFDQSGRVVYLLSEGRDITDRKKAAESYTLLRAVTEGTTDAIFVKDEHGRYLMINIAGARLLGKSVHEVIGKDDTELFAPDSARSIREQDLKIMTGGEPQTLEEAITSAGVTRTYHVTKGPYRDDQGHIIGLWGISREVTETKQREAEFIRLNQDLQRKVAELETLFEIVPIGIAVAEDIECKVIRPNQTFAQMLGVPPNANISKSLPANQLQGNHHYVRDGRELTANELPMQTAAASGAAVTNVKFDLVRGDGRVLKLIGNAAPLRNPEGKVTGVIATFWDIEDFRRTEERLRTEKEAAESANKAKDQFLAMLSHELRTPLTPVLAGLLSLGNDQRLPTDVLEELAMVRRNVELEARLIDDLLDMTRISRGKVELHHEVVNTHLALRQALEIYDQDIAAKGLDVLLSLKAQHPLIWADPARIQQVFWNLIGNAVKFTGEQGRITLRSADVEGGRIRIEIVDNGIGIEAATLGRLFNAFEQGERMVTRRFGGLGLGLTISKTLVEMHEGSLTVFSEGKDKGATFTVEFATIAQQQPKETPLPLEKGAASNHQQTILYVEDHADTQRIMAKVLRGMGYTVKAACCVHDALKALDQKIDLLISDIALPDGTGLEIMLEAKKRSGIPGIALSGFGMEEDVLKSHEAGFAQHVTKPVNIEALEAAIHRLLDKGASAD